MGGVNSLPLPQLACMGMVQHASCARAGGAFCIACFAFGSSFALLCVITPSYLSYVFLSCTTPAAKGCSGSAGLERGAAGTYACFACVGARSPRGGLSCRSNCRGRTGCADQSTAHFPISALPLAHLREGAAPSSSCPSSSSGRPFTVLFTAECSGLTVIAESLGVDW